MFSAVALAACASGFESVQSENRAKLYLLERGQTREQVLEEMGTEPQEYRKGVLSSGVVQNPHASESHVVDGEKIEVFYYATHIKNNDGVITSDELTPLVLVDDVLVGWGWQYLGAFAEEYDLRLEGPPSPPLPSSGS
jgi:hypothetical protein